MGWIKRKADEPAEHQCPTPRREAVSPDTGAPTGYTIPVGDVGDIWACDTCGTVWVMSPPPPPRYRYGCSPRSREWVRASRRMQRKRRTK